MDRRVEQRPGEDGLGTAVMEWTVSVRHGVVGNGAIRQSRQVRDRFGTVRNGSQGKSRQAVMWNVGEWQSGIVSEGLVEVVCGMAVKARLCASWFVQARKGVAVLDSSVMDW